MSTIASLIVRVSSDTKAFVSGMQQSSVAATVMKGALVGAGSAIAGHALGIRSSTNVVVAAGQAFKGMYTAIRSGNSVVTAATSGIAGLGVAFSKTLGGALLIGGALLGVATAAVTAAAALASITGSAISGALKLAASYEQTEIALKSMTGSAKTAAKLLAEINRFEAATPFEFDELAKASKNLVAFGTAPGAVVPTLRTLGNIAAAVSVPIGELSEVYGKIMVQGRVFQEDLNQLGGRGIPVMKALQQEFGKSGEEIRAMVRDGELSIGHLQRALVQIGDVQFASMMGEQAKSLNGLFSTLSSSLSAIKRDLGGAFADVVGFKDLVKDAISAADAVRDLASGLEWLAKKRSELRPETGSAGSIAQNVGRFGILGGIPGMGMLNRARAIAGLSRDAAALGGASPAKEQTLADHLAAIANSAGNVEKSTQQLARLRDESMRLFNDTRTPAEQYAKSVKDVFSMIAFGGLDLQTAGRSLKMFREELDKTLGASQRESNKAFLDFWKQGQSVIEGARTPLEKYRATFQDLVKLFAVGAIDLKTLGKANAAAHADFTKSAAKGKSFKSPLQNTEFVRDFFFDNIGGVAPDKKKAETSPRYAGAIEAGTSAAYAASLRENTPVQNQQQRQHKENVDVLKSVRKVLERIERKTGIKLVEVDIG